MNKIGVYFGRPTTFVKDNNNYYDHLYFTKGSYFINSKKNNIDKFDNLSLFKNTFNTQIEHYNKKYTVYKTWQEFYVDIDVSFLKDYNLLYYFYPMVIDVWNENKRCNYNYSDLNHRANMKFLSYGTEMANAVVLAKASELYKIPLYQYNFELGAADLRKLGLKPFGYRKFHGYKYKDNECLISLPYYYNNIEKNWFETQVTKTTDFTFYGTYEKDECPTKITEVENLKTNYLSKFNKIDFKFIERKKEKNKRTPLKSYIEKLKESKYTFIAPSYVNDVVAIDRFVEGLFNDCLPLFGDSVYLKDVSETFDYDFEKIRIKNFSLNEQDRLKTIEEIKSQILKQENPRKIIGIDNDQ